MNYKHKRRRENVVEADLEKNGGLVAQYKYHTEGSLQAKTIVTCVRIF